MKIVILNGSPKGNELSITMQYFYYVRKYFPQHDYRIFAIGEKIKKIEGDPATFAEIMDTVADCDGLIWIFPVYITVVPAQVKRFVELIAENKKEDVFAGKYSTAITTSVYVFDITAHNYIHAVSEDLGMGFVRGYSASVADLPKPECQKSFKNFFAHFIKTTENREAVPRQFNTVTWDNPVYRVPKMNGGPKSSEKRIVVLTDHQPETNLANMVETFKVSSKYEVEVVNLNDVSIKGPCLGCLTCVFDGVCVYKDDMKQLYEQKLIPADAIIFAGTMVDRYLSSRWKTFWDRSFFNGHRPILWGKQVAYLVSGPLRQNPNVTQFMEGLILYSRAGLVGTVTDEAGDDDATFNLIKQLAQNVDRRLEDGGIYQTSFHSLGTHLILRDLIYNISFVLKADHEFFKENKLYDFPQKDWKARMTNILLTLLFKIPPIGRSARKEVKKMMVEPLQKFVEKSG
ncbi:MAG: NAD(P)H-dependent oxidoreductase [Deltaproteobacteria bacterium]|nr:MAG: NAD(P)H-dependent oxidoreductase [Deltaproteobacteria bacterium]